MKHYSYVRTIGEPTTQGDPMLTIRFQEPMDKWVKTAANAEALTAKAFTERAVERELARLAEGDVMRRILRALGWKAKGPA